MKCNKCKKIKPDSATIHTSFLTQDIKPMENIWHYVKRIGGVFKPTLLCGQCRQLLYEEKQNLKKEYADALQDICAEYLKQ